MESSPILQKLANVDCLPSPPQVAMKVVQVCQDPSQGLRELSDVLSLDSALSAKILRISNSASYCRGREITTLSQAINALGTKSISIIALGFSLKNVVPAWEHEDGLSDVALWRRSVATAVASRSLARLTGFADRETAFLCGLLARIGQLLLFSIAPDEYDDAVRAAHGRLPSAATEKKCLGVTHHQVGRMLLEKWDLPDVMQEVVSRWGDDDVLEIPDREVQQIAAIVNVSDAVAQLLLGDDKAMELQRLHRLADGYLSIAHGEIDRMFIACQLELQETLAVFDDAAYASINCETILNTARQQLVQVSLGLAADLTQAERNATSLAEANRSLQTACETDALTALPNRAALDKELTSLFETRASDRNSRPFSVVMVDIDKFKKFNDDHGHAVGDQVLQAVAATLFESARATDFVARYGGEEFTVILTNAGKANAAEVAERYRAAVENRGIELANATLSVTASFGVASADEFPQGATCQEIVVAADAALYAAKRLGRNRVVSYRELQSLRDVSARASC